MQGTEHVKSGCERWTEVLLGMVREAGLRYADDAANPHIARGQNLQQRGEHGLLLLQKVYQTSDFEIPCLRISDWAKQQCQPEEFRASPEGQAGLMCSRLRTSKIAQALSTS